MAIIYRDGVAGKICSRCGEWKNLGSFYRRLISKDGFRSECKDCFLLNQKQKYENNKDAAKERVRRYQKEHSDTRREYMRQYQKKNSIRLLDYLRGRRQQNVEEARSKARDYYTTTIIPNIESTSGNISVNGDVATPKKEYRPGIVAAQRNEKQVEDLQPKSGKLSKDTTTTLAYAAVVVNQKLSSHLIMSYLLVPLVREKFGMFNHFASLATVVREQKRLTTDLSGRKI